MATPATEASANNEGATSSADGWRQEASGQPGTPEWPLAHFAAPEILAAPPPVKAASLAKLIFKPAGAGQPIVIAAEEAVGSIAAGPAMNGAVAVFGLSVASLRAAGRTPP